MKRHHTRFTETIPVKPYPRMVCFYRFQLFFSELQHTKICYYLSYPTKAAVLKNLGMTISAMATRLGEDGCPSDQQDYLGQMEEVVEVVKKKWPKNPPAMYMKYLSMPRNGSLVRISIFTMHGYP